MMSHMPQKKKHRKHRKEGREGVVPEHPGQSTLSSRFPPLGNILSRDEFVFSVARMSWSARVSFNLSEVFNVPNWVPVLSF